MNIVPFFRSHSSFEMMASGYGDDDFESDEDDLFGPFSSTHIPTGLALEINSDSDSETDNTAASDTDMDDEGGETSPPIQLRNTRLLRQRLGPNPSRKVLDVLLFMESKGLNLPIFLDLLSWGEPQCITHPRIRYERSALMVSEELPSIISRWHNPPRTQTSTNRRARGAKPVLERFAFSCVSNVVNKELEGIKDILLCPAEDLSSEELTSLCMEDLILKFSSPGFGGTPKLWSLLLRLTQTSRQKHENKEKSPDLVILSIVSQVMFSRSQHHNRFAKMLTTFLRAQGASAKSLDLLRCFGLTMSHQWSIRALKTISRIEMETVQRWVHQHAFVITHDNINIPFRVFSQRIDNQSHFDSGTASTVFFQPNAPPEQPLCNRTLQEHRAAARNTPLTARKILDLAQLAASSQHDRDVSYVLRYLVKSPEFNFDSYDGRDSPIFAGHKPVKLLPSGPQYITRQFMLGTEHLEEASYEGNVSVMAAVLHQLKLDTEEEMMKTGLERVIVWVGDQLTSARLRGLFGFRAQDRNAFERLDWLVPTFGWFHLLMAFANSLHKQYLGTTAGRGLMHAFTLLERKGLSTVQTRGPFHQNLHDAIYHVTEAHFRACWKVIAGVDDLSELQSRSPDELYTLAVNLLDKLASSAAIDQIKMQPEDHRDQILLNSILWNRDALRYLDLYEATKNGDVGIMEESLPYLAFRFAGGGNSNYLTEVLELLQCLQYDWPPALRDYVQRRCWLVNMTGHPSKFMPLDKRQEYNIKHIKVTDRVQGPNASWDLLKDRSPSIPMMQSVRKHFERQVRSLRRGLSHTEPSKDKDVARLEEAYIHSNVHVEDQGRVTRTTADIVKDVVTLGGERLTMSSTLAKWWLRRDLERETTEIWK